MRKGIAVSPGVAIGTAYCLHEIYVNPHTKRLEDNEVSGELARYETARDKAAADLRALHSKVESQVGVEEASVFAVHEMILRDAAFTNKIRGWIVDERIVAQAALQRLLKEYTSLFARTKDEYLRERLNDVRDVVVRLSAHLSDAIRPRTRALPGPLIIVANELLPSHVVALGDAEVHGVVTQGGSQTSHAAILARSRGIPAVSGIRNIMRQVKTGDTLIVDGRDGHVLINPSPEAKAAYRKLEREFFHLKDQLAENRHHPALTADNVCLELQANINGLADAKAASAMGASGVGLFRTEYMYLTHPNVPDEDEQLSIYHSIIQSTPNHSITIRTLDIGGDKTVPYLGHTHQEANPFLGWRSIRLSFEHPEFFSTQIRAVLRSATEAERLGGQVRLMFPMITTVEEMRRVNAIVRRARKQLSLRSKPFGTVPIGMMLEVPAAAVSIEVLLGATDFVSIGSNDLIQYLMAADRDNPKVNHLCQPLSPPVLQVLSQVITSCVNHGKPVNLCGEMAGQPQAFPLLLGMGLRSFSMSPSFIPSIKELAGKLRIDHARGLLARALRLKTTAQVNRLMTEEIERVAPKLGILATN